jgi:CRISPR-associated protein Csx14
MRAAGDESPVAVVLAFLASAEVFQVKPVGFVDPSFKNKRESSEETDEEEMSLSPFAITSSETFPSREADRMSLPVRFTSSGYRPIVLQHWADGSTRKEFKLYAGNRSAYGIARAMLRGTRAKPTKKQIVGSVKTDGIASLWSKHQDLLIAKPFDVLTLIGGSFNLDPRGAWTALDAGYSPNEHKDHGIASSPVVEILAAFGLENARPDEYATRQVRYAVWSGMLPTSLARPVLASTKISVPIRTFRFTLELSGKNKVVTFAQEEAHS